MKETSCYRLVIHIEYCLFWSLRQTLSVVSQRG